MAVGVERRAKKVASRLDQALLLQPVSNAMSYNPLTQTTGVGLSAPTTSIHTSEDRHEYNHTLPAQAALPSPQQPAHKKRRPSKDKTTTAIRRSSSTPHMRNLALGTTGELSPTSDKRRNKLGYHRTSVACGHCRRRKIRCLVANDEPTGRCANCIRLKKECNFYPVDQNPENPRPQTGAIKDVNPGASASATSSPRHPPSMSGEKIDEFRPPFNGPVSGNPVSRYGVPGDPEVEPHHVPPSSGVPMQQQPPYGYPHAIDTQWPPAPGFLPSTSVAESPSSSSGYWRPSPSTANSTYGSESNVSGGHTPATMSTSSTMSYGGQPDSHNWGAPGFQPPTRSMSYGNIEGIPQQYSNPGLGIQQHDYPRRTSPYPYPSTIDTSPSTLRSSSIGGHTSAPLSAPILPNQQYSYPTPWNPYGGGPAPAPAPGHEMPAPSRSMSGQWYHEPGQLDQVQEEGGPPISYSHHGIQQFYSGP
ncbi:hypothetical protein BU26DRAFT_36586 [Trematosphaeria pertusa]|uniref:Zn(2)-C6 fungal-type domain-containing protein n=1 Tax=Trematosphaeria pertusa TaxID=390896 RepID=A0A6A6J3I3_9PLEO|nr:uncharacterized protein BU26DRAFT_36586 [Trematosphaeria pertusa]KAF2257128.1 hypothetical protein BU26DRAFT_36586 [Trematosphaeria pertusa]